jgi:iron complex transport system substrate-binding protein
MSCGKEAWMNPIRLFWAVAVVGLAGLAGCSQASLPGISSSPTYTDDIGRRVQVQGVPQRIISLSPSNTEMIYALGLQDRLVGITSFDNYPPEVKNKTVVSDYSTTDMEKIVSEKPDLVLADSIQKNDTVPALEKLGIKVFTMAPDSADMIFNDLKVLGQITDKAREADNLVTSLKSRIQAVADKTAVLADTQKPRVLYVTWHDPIWTAGGDTMIQYLIDKAGGINIASDLKGYTTITLETAVQRNPQVIVVMSSMGAQNVSLDFIKSNDQFKSTDALKNGRVYEIDADIFGRTTPRIVDGLETLANLVHPELFK